MLYTAVIKGNADEAITAATNRGISVHSIFATMEQEVTLVVDTNIPILNDWFTEQLGKAPYPAGTLLYYNLYTERSYGEAANDTR